MKKAFPYIIAVGLGLIALYAVYHFRTTRLLPEQLEEMRAANERLEEVEQAESGTNDEPADPVSANGSKPASALAGVTLNELPSAQLPEEAPEVFHVLFVTTDGNFVVECRKDWAPNGVQRFYELVKMGFYDDIRVFRVVSDFVVQFGISKDPELNELWMDSTIPDDPVKQSNTRGKLTFAASGQPNSRSTQVFINLTSEQQNTRLDAMGFAPIGEVIYGMDTVDKFYSGYGESLTKLQSQIAAAGNALLDSQYPRLSAIDRASVIERIPDPAATSPEAEPAPVADSNE